MPSRTRSDEVVSPGSIGRPTSRTTEMRLATRVRYENAPARTGRRSTRRPATVSVSCRPRVVRPFTT